MSKRQNHRSFSLAITLSYGEMFMTIYHPDRFGQESPRPRLMFGHVGKGWKVPRASRKISISKEVSTETKVKVVKDRIWKVSPGE